MAGTQGQRWAKWPVFDDCKRVRAMELATSEKQYTYAAVISQHCLALLSAHSLRACCGMLDAAPLKVTVQSGTAP